MVGADLSSNEAGELPGSIGDVLSAFNQSAMGIYVVISNERLVQGIITDGDVRRALLDGVALSESAEKILNRAPLLAPASLDRYERQAKMRSHGVRHLVVTDAGGKFLAVESLSSTGAERANWVVIMAGGLGQRMLPHTLEVPKPMLPVRGQPILEHIIDKLANQGFRNFAISVNYLSDQIEDHFRDGSGKGLRIEYLKELHPLGTAGSLGMFTFPTAQPVLVVNGDVMTDADFGEMLRIHTEAASYCTVGVKQVQFQNPYGVVETDGSAVVGYAEKPISSSLVSAGVYVFDSNVFETIDGHKALDMPDLIRVLVESGSRVGAYPLVESWIDVGRPADYRAVGGDL